MNRKLEKLSIWLTVNKLSLNISKTQHMVYDRGKEKTDQYSLFLNNILIDRVKYTKCLVVIIEEKLNLLYAKRIISQNSANFLQNYYL